MIFVFKCDILSITPKPSGDTIAGQTNRKKKNPPTTVYILSGNLPLTVFLKSKHIFLITLYKKNKNINKYTK